MNRFALNRSALNSGLITLVLATASIACSASVSAAAIRTADALAPTSSSAELTANAQLIRLGSAAFLGAGDLYPQVTHSQAATATLQSSAEVTAFVLRIVAADATVQAGCNVVAIAAGVLGQAQPSGSAQVLASATRAQAARSDAQGFSEVTLSVAPTAIRMAVASVQGSASVRAEESIRPNATLNTLHSAYGSISCATEMVASALATRLGSIDLSGGASLSATANIQQPAHASASGASNITADPATYALTGSFIRFGTAEILAQATRVLVPGGVVAAGASSVSAGAQQTHAASSLVASTSAVVAGPVAIQLMQASVMGTCVTTAAARLTMMSARAQIECGAEVVAETISNPASFDPTERTFVSPMRTTEFARPFIESEFRRAA